MYGRILYYMKRQRSGINSLNEASDRVWEDGLYGIGRTLNISVEDVAEAPTVKQIHIDHLLLVDEPQLHWFPQEPFFR